MCTPRMANILLGRRGVQVFGLDLGVEVPYVRG